MKLKVMTYNIHAGRNNLRPSDRSYDFSAEVINHVAPDIVGLNEVGKGGFPKLEMEEEAAEYLGKKTGMNWYFAKAVESRGYPYGNALLSKYPIKSARTVMIPDPEREEDNEFYETRCILVAELDVAGGVTVMVSHFGLMPDEKESAVRTVVSLLASIETPVLLMGDLNMLPDDAKLQPIFERMRDSAGGAMTPYTWPSDVGNISEYERTVKKITENNARRRIDYIFTSDDFTTKKVEVYETLASDHLPYIVNVELCK